MEKNVFEMSEQERQQKDIGTLPGNLYEAIKLTENSELVKKALGEHVFDIFIQNKKVDWERYCSQVTDYELKQYLAVL